MRVEEQLGTVVNNDDPAKGGAITVSLPDIGGDEYPEWVEPVTLGCLFFHPEPGDIVAVTTPEGEDITEFSDEVRYSGRVITEGEGYPVEFKTNYPYRRGFKTKAGHMLIVDDKDGTVTLQNGKSGDKIVMAADGSVTIDSSIVKLTAGATDAVIKGTTLQSALAVLPLLATNPLCPEVAIWCNALLLALQNMPLSSKATVG